MKRVFFLFLFISLPVFSFAQKVELSTSVKEELMDILLPALQKCINNFGGTYIPGTKIKSAYRTSETVFIINGTLNYKGEQCGRVSDIPYKVTIYKEGSQTFGETCIYTPYCLWGVVTSQEWDCDCKKWQYGKDNAVKGAVDILILLQRISN